MTATAVAFAAVPNVEKIDVRKLNKAQLKREVVAMRHVISELCMCSFLPGSALAGYSRPIVDVSLPWSVENLAGPIIAVIVIGAVVFGLLISAISFWLAAKVVVSDRETTFGQAAVVCFLQLLLGIGIVVVRVILMLATGATFDSLGGTLIALGMYMVAIPFSLMIPERMYGIGPSRAFGLNLLGSCFNLFICGIACGVVFVVGGVGLEAARAKFQATVERVRHAEADVIKPTRSRPQAPPDLAPEIDGLLEAALHPHGPPPLLAEREAMVRQLQEKLQTERNNLPLNDAFAVAAYQNRLNRYLLLLNAVKTERQAQAARDAAAGRQTASGLPPAR